MSVAPPKPHHPLAEHGRINQGVAPEQVPETRVTVHETKKVCMLNEGQPGGAQRRQAMIHHLQVQALEVGDVAADVEGQDLPLALSRDNVAAGEALDDQAALGGNITFTDDVLICRNGSQPQRQAQQGRLFLRRKRGDALQLADQRGGLRMNGIRDSLPRWSSVSVSLPTVSARG